MPKHEWLQRTRVATLALAFAGFSAGSFADEAVPPSEPAPGLVDEAAVDDNSGVAVGPELIRTLDGQNQATDESGEGPLNEVDTGETVTTDGSEVLDLSDEEAQLAAQRNLDEAPADPNIDPNVMFYNVAPGGEVGAPAAALDANTAGVTDYVDTAGDTLRDGVAPATDIAVAGEAQSLSASGAADNAAGQIRGGHLRAR